MPYLGRQPSIGRFAHLDDITSSFNSACTTFSLMQSSVALVPGAASNLIISLGGVLQEPEVAYTVAGSSIIFSSAPANTQPFFGILLGDVLDVGQVSQGAVINATSLTVTGAATVSTTLGVTGATTLSSTVATGALTITGAATYTTSLKSTTALATPGALTATQATAFASTVSGAAIMGFGTTNDVSLMNRAGTVVLGVGPNTTAVNMTGALGVAGLLTVSGNAATFGVEFNGSNGGGIAATHASGALRFYSGGTALRARFTTNGDFEMQAGKTLTMESGNDLIIDVPASRSLFLKVNAVTKVTLNPSGQFSINTASESGGVAAARVNFDPTLIFGIIVHATVDAGGSRFMRFYNAAGTEQGSIQATNSTTTAFVTSSDKRLKEDLGLAADLTELRGTVVHKFRWKPNGILARGVFAQDEYARSPFAISKGDDTLTPTGELAKPWGVDYSKFVPDLIVGWQQHDATITQLAARIAALETKDH